MTYVGIYEAIRIIVRASDAEMAEGMTDSWIKRGGFAFEPFNAVVPDAYRRAAACLTQAIKSPHVDVIVLEKGAWRPIAKIERADRLDIREAALDRSPLPWIRDIRILEEDIKRVAAGTGKKQAAAHPQQTSLDELIRRLLAEDPNMASETARKKCAGGAGVIPPKNKFRLLWRKAGGSTIRGRKPARRAAE
jgi:hypothetical protein